MNYPRVTLRRGREQSVKRRHPWIFTGAIERRDDDARDGAVVRVEDSDGDFLALGHYSEGPSIAVRIFAFEEREAGYELWREKLEAAYALRRTLLAAAPGTDVYRLAHGEGDGLPGLVVDIYGTAAVVQFHAVGMWSEREHIAAALRDTLGKNVTTIYNKSQATMPAAFADQVRDEFWMGSQGCGIVTENGHRFMVDWVEGQKTGFFIDQRENRALVGRMSAGRRVCNMFGYTGGFSVYALAGGARSVDTVDASRPAVERAAHNAALNFPDNDRHRAVAADAFDFLAAHGSDYDLLILDPPAFAKHRGTLDNALKGYRRLNQLALERVRPNSLVFTFSCSQAVSMADFRKTVFVAAASARRDARLIAQMTQPADHPVSMYHPEGEYLKGLALYIA